MKIKPNCRRCFYAGVYSPSERLASCDCGNNTEQTIVKFDPLFKKERNWVYRKEWEEECDCEHFIPHLSEGEGDYELEAVCSFSTSFECPFCGNTVNVWDIGIEETAIIICDECEKQIAVEGKEL